MYNKDEICSCGHRHGLHTTNVHGLSENGMCLVDGCECMKFRPTKRAPDSPSAVGSGQESEDTASG